MVRALNWIKRYAPGGYVRFDLAMDEVFNGNIHERYGDTEFILKEIYKRGLKCWFVFNESIPNKTEWRRVENIPWKPDTPALYPWWNIPIRYWQMLDANVQAVLNLANSVFGTLEGHLVEDGNERCNTQDKAQIPGLVYGEMPNNFLDRQLDRWNHSDKMQLYRAKWIGSSMEGGHAFDTELKSSKPLIQAAGCMNYHTYGVGYGRAFGTPAYIGETASVGVSKYKRSLDLRNRVESTEKLSGAIAVCGYAAMSLDSPEYSVLRP
jgi:hypothetical protein